MKNSQKLKTIITYYHAHGSVGQLSLEAPSYRLSSGVLDMAFIGSDQWLSRANDVFLETHSRARIEGAVLSGVCSYQGSLLQLKRTCPTEQARFKPSLVRFTNFPFIGQSKLRGQTRSQKWENILYPLWQRCGWRTLLQWNKSITAPSAPGPALVQASALDNRNTVLGDLPASSLPFPNLAAARVIFFSLALLPS